MLPNQVWITLICVLMVVEGRSLPTDLDRKGRDVSSTSDNMVSARIGKTASLHCDITGVDKPHVIEWVKRGIPVPVFIKIGQRGPHISPEFQGRMSLVGGTSLHITNVTGNDEGWYECRVLKFVGEVFQKSSNGTWVKLIVTAPPSFTTLLVPTVRKNSGDSLRLKCEATGRPLPEITWHKDGAPVKNGKNGIHVTNTDLSINHLTAIHRGKYTCRAQSVEGQIQTSTNVLIKAPPSYVTKPVDTTAKEGKDAVFYCKAEGYPESIKYRWLYNGTSVEDFPAIFNRYSVLETSIVLYNLTPTDKGTVTCVVDNGFGKPQSASAKLFVQFSARVVNMPSVVYGGFELRTTLICPSVAEPPVNMVVWFKDGDEIRIRQDMRYRTDGNGSLIIGKTRLADAGRYTCKPYNMLGSYGVSAVSKLIVKDPPYFRVAPNHHYEVEIGKPLTITCSGDGDPKPSVSWEKMENLNDVEYEDVNGQLRITSVNSKHHGVWRCVLKNKVAQVFKDVSMLVKYTSPHPVSNLQARALSGSSAQIRWKPGYNGGFPQYFVLWYKNEYKNDWQTVEVIGNRSEVILTNLLPNTSYEIAVLPTNNMGSGEFSDTVIVKTFATVNKPKSITSSRIPSPQSLYTKITSKGLVQLSWRQPMMTPSSKYSRNSKQAKPLLGFLVEYKRIRPDPSDPEMDSSSSNKDDSRSKRSYHFVYKRDLTGNDQDWKTLTTAKKNTSSLVIGANHLYRDQVYEFRVLAVSNNEYSLPSNSVSMSTKGLSAYPCFKGYIAAGALLRHPVILGVLGGICLMALLIIVLFVIYCRRRLRRKKHVIDGNGSSITQPSLKNITDSEVKRATNGRAKERMIVEIPEYSTKFEIESKPLISQYTNGRVLTSPASNFSSFQAASSPMSSSSLSPTNQTYDEKIVPGSHSDRSSVRIRRETVARILQEQVKRRSLSDQSRYRITKHSVYRGGTRSASTSPERSYQLTSSSSGPERLNVTDPGLLTRSYNNNFAKRRYYPKYSQPIDGKEREKMVVFSRKSNRGQLGGSVTSSRASSESPVFGVIGSLNQYNSSSVLKLPPLINESHNSSSNSKKYFLSASAKPKRDSISLNKNKSPMRTKESLSPRSPISPLEDDVFNNNKFKLPRDFSPRDDPWKYSSSVFASSPKENEEKTSPNRVVARKTVAYSNSLTPTKEYTPEKLKNKTSSLNRTYTGTPSLSVYNKNNYPRVTRSNDELLDTRDDVGSQPSQYFDKRRSWNQRNFEQFFPPQNLRAQSAQSRNSYSYGHQPMSAFNPSRATPRRVLSTPVEYRDRGRVAPCNNPRSQPDVEIDCSNSDIEVRIIADQSIGYPSTYGRGEMGSVASATITPSSHDERTTLTQSTSSDSDFRRISPTKANTRFKPELGTCTEVSSVDSRDQNKNGKRESMTLSPTSVLYPRNLTSPNQTNTRRKSSQVSPPPGAVTSSGYGSHDNSNNSTSPSIKNNIERNSRKDTSSVEDNYEWDSEIAMETEILEALRNFGNHKTTGPVSEELMDELNKFTKDRKRIQKVSQNSASNVPIQSDLLSQDGADYSKESIARRCAALRAEFLHYQQMQQLDEERPTS